MGEYYDWVNVDKHQYLVPMEFGHGSKRFESWFYHDAILGALYSLLYEEWKGDHIAFIGDYADRATMCQNKAIDKLKQQMENIHYQYDIYSYYLDYYTNISGLFKEAEEKVREEIGIILEYEETHNCYGIDLANPYRGLFQREGKFYRYVINQDRKEYYDTEKTCLLENGCKVDPLPFLMSYGEYASDDKYAGIWLGNSISVTDREPGLWCKDITDTHIWDFDMN